MPWGPPMEPPDPPEECPKCGAFECEHTAQAEADAEDYAETVAMERYYERKYGRYTV